MEKAQIKMNAAVINEYEQKPLVSVILPVYNGAKTIQRAVQSILLQTYGNFELIVINDGSIDNTRSILNNFNDRRLTVLEQGNKGIVISLNRGIEISKGQYIARADADEVSHPERLKKQVDFLEKNSDTGIVGTATEVVYPDGKTNIRYRPADTASIIKNITKVCPFSHGSVLIRKSVFNKVGPYDLESSVNLNAEDFDMWIKIMLAGYDMANLPDVLVSYYREPDSITRRVSLLERLKQKMLLRIKIIKSLNLSYWEYFNLIPVAVLNTLVHFNFIHIDNFFNYLLRNDQRKLYSLRKR